MILVERGTVAGNSRRPLILTLDVHGQPFRWVSWQHAVIYYARDQVAWSAGDNEFMIHGGMRRDTGLRSVITANSIIAIRGKALSQRALQQVPPLSNRELFHRDRQVCGYCGTHLPAGKLTRDHVLPVSQGGRDIWMNVVTACDLSRSKSLPVHDVSEWSPAKTSSRSVSRTRNRYQLALRVRKEAR
ncbi:HNH endonuclease [Niveibacterium sp.]|uniref:HNH endonuclease n=1 Tax=Niveibacterium sp. TaxID=2017444 RepID=UPI0035AE2759